MTRSKKAAFLTFEPTIAYLTHLWMQIRVATQPTLGDYKQLNEIHFMNSEIYYNKIRYWSLLSKGRGNKNSFVQFRTNQRVL